MMFVLNTSRSLLAHCSALSAAVRPLHLAAPSYAVVKKTTAAAGGVMGLGKGKGKKGGKLGLMEKMELPVESDPHKLVTRVCGSNIHTTGEDVPLRPAAEYPSWLWSLRTEGAPPLSALDPTSKRYWLRVRAAGMRRNNKLKAMKKF